MSGCKDCGDHAPSGQCGYCAQIELEDLVAAWHKSGDEETRELHEYLGMTFDEYAEWVMSNELPENYEIPNRKKETPDVAS